VLWIVFWQTLELARKRFRTPDGIGGQMLHLRQQRSCLGQ